MAGMIAAICAPGEVAAATDGLEGRWQSVANQRGDSLALDISRCGAGWCGVRLGAGGGCDAMILRLGQDMRGSLQLTPKADVFDVHAAFYPDLNGQLMLEGSSRRSPFPAARTFGYQRAFARTGEPLCAGVSALDQKTVPGENENG